MPAAVTLLLLAVVGQSLWRGRSIAARVAALTRSGGRPRALYGWALGTAVTFCLPALLALALLGRIDAAWAMPPELVALAHALGLAAAIGPDLAWTLGSLALGGGIGMAIVALRARRGGRVWVVYRSPAEARGPTEWGGAAAIAVAAGISEEIFFRLALPLSAGTALGSMAAGLAIATASFGLAHRHQGWAGMALTMVIGAALAWLYLHTGALWLAMLVHVAIDINALILRPALQRR